jgi:hypothetical protein
MYVTPTKMMCFLLSLVWLGVIMFTVVTLFQDNTTYFSLVVSCAILGLGISSIYPVGLTIAQDYGIVMDSRTISICCIGAVSGEAVVPACFGVLMNTFTPVYLTYCTLVVAVIVTVLYVIIHVLFVRVEARIGAVVSDKRGDVELNVSGKSKKQACADVAFNPLNNDDVDVDDGCSDGGISCTDTTTTACRSSRKHRRDDVNTKGVQMSDNVNNDVSVVVDAVVHQSQTQREESLW